MTSEPLRFSRIDEVDFFKRGKVREIYDLGDTFLMVATDRISCFDVVLPTAIPRKGEVLTRLSLFWFDLTKDIVPNHLITADSTAFPAELQKHASVLAGRAMIVKKAKPLSVECVVRGYLSGSGWKEYQQAGAVCGVALPKGLRESDKLPEPIFTPSTKEDHGHDINVTQEFIEKEIGADITNTIRTLSLEIYKRARDYADTKGIIIADTKFEFGLVDDAIILIDEVLTPDSSRFWPKNDYQPGKTQPSFDKQFVRDYLETVDWDKTYPGPHLPDEIASKTTEKYLQALTLLTGQPA